MAVAKNYKLKYSGEQLEEAVQNALRTATGDKNGLMSPDDKKKLDDFLTADKYLTKEEAPEAIEAMTKEDIDEACTGNETK